MLITSNYNDMGNAKKTIIHIPKLGFCQYFILIDVLYYLKIPLI